MTPDIRIPEHFDRAALVERARALHDRNFNCAQSVACALGPELGADEDLCFRMAEGLGGGLGKHTETCGALLGAALVLGFARSNGCADPTSKLATYDLVARAAASFREQYGTSICGEIRALDTSGEKPLTICQACIDDALLAAIDILEEV